MLGAAALLPAAPLLARESEASFAPLSEVLRDEIAARASSDLRGFYSARGNRPVWVDADGHVSPAGEILLRQLASAKLDGLKPGKLKARSLEKALGRAREATPETLAKAEGEATLTVGIRPEAFAVSPDGTGIGIDVSVLEELGADSYLYGTLAGLSDNEKLTAQQIIARVAARTAPDRGNMVRLVADPANVHVFSTKSGLRIS